MKKAKDVEDLAGRLAAAAATPLIAPASPAPSPKAARERPAKPKKKQRSLSVFLRVPHDLHERLEAEAIARTKRTGRGVTIQQIILEKAARPE
jgi:hypothetical protein